jgi:hypothetical protein
VDRRAPFAPPTRALRLKPLGRIKPSAEEIKANPRSRSAVLRVAERLPQAGGRREPAEPVLLLALMASAMYLVKTSYEARRAFADLERPRPRSASWPPTPCGWRPSAAAKAHLRVERDAREAADAPGHAGRDALRERRRGPAASSATTGAAP